MEMCQAKEPRKANVPLDLALNRVLATSIVAKENVPKVDRSAVDGYAVKAKGTVGASQFKARMLTLTDSDEVGDGQARQVWTGNPVLAGADTVVMLENTKRIGDVIEVWTPLAPGENVQKKGEDIAKGETALEAGIRLRPQHLGLMAALGMAEVEVFEKPKVAILATGNELAEVGGKPHGSQVFDVDRHVVSALCRELDAEPLDLGIAEDDAADICEKLRAGLAADIVITTGGTSVGASDLVPEAVDKMGKPGVIVSGVAMRPAMPTALAVVKGKPVIMLSGNPVAAMIAFEVFARPLICRMLGLKQPEVRPIVKARLTRKVQTVFGRRTFVRVHVFEQDGVLLSEPVSAHGSGTISTMIKANGYVAVPENREGLEEGEIVSVHLFDDVRVVENV